MEKVNFVKQNKKQNTKKNRPKRSNSYAEQQQLVFCAPFLKTMCGCQSVSQLVS